MGKLKRGIIEFAFFLVIAPLLSWSVICGVLSCTYISPDLFSVYIMSVAACLFFRLVLHDSKTLFIAFIVFSVVSLVVADRKSVV